MPNKIGTYNRAIDIRGTSYFGCDIVNIESGCICGGIDNFVKYFFLTEGWSVARVWGVEGVWNELAWRRQPQIERMNLCIVENQETMWLYKVEEAVIMVEVKPGELRTSKQTIGQVMLKRLMSAEQAIERLGASEVICQIVKGSIRN